MERVTAKHEELLQEIERLETDLKEKRKSLGVVEKEESWLKERVQLRSVQENLLNKRLTEGWEDEALAMKPDDGAVNDADRAEI